MWIDQLGMFVLSISYSPEMRVSNPLYHIVVLVLFSAGLLRGGAPSGYYQGGENLTGGELKQALHEIIRRDHRYGLTTHTVIPYGNLFAPLREIWRDPEIPANVLLAYSSMSTPGFSSTWNREHLWPRSRGNTDQFGPDDSDLFHVVPTDTQVNSLRSNRYFDRSDPNDPSYVIPASPFAPQASYDSNSWQPAPDERGDIARAMFYMDVRYNGTEAYTTDLELVAFAPSGAQMGHLNTLLLWHAEDPPDDSERARNDLIYANYQGNRNPFIDHPEFVTAIWGTGLPGDPLNLPLARVEAVAATAAENPTSAARIVASLNQFAGPGGVVISFQLAGTADLDEFTLGGDVTAYDPETGLGSVRVQEGYATGLILITPRADAEPEEPETVELSLLGGEGYNITPDSSSVALVTLRDAPSLPVAWNFNTFATTDRILSANSGEGILSLSNWTGTVNAFGGTTGNSLALASNAGNGSWIDFSFSMGGYRDLSLSFWTRGTSSGFDTGTWSFSTDGLNFTIYEGVNTATRQTSFILQNVDFSPFSSLNNAGLVILRYTLSGATSTSGNNRIDDLTFSAMPLVTGDALREASVVASAATALESPRTPAVFSMRLNGLAPAGGLTVGFALSGTAEPDVDYAVTGVQSWDPVSRTGTVYFEENEDTKFVGVEPVDDGVPESLESVVLILSAPPEESYLLGASTTATATIRDLGLNDNFADAYVLEGAPVNTTGENLGATRETGEPRHAGFDGGRSVWWRWTAPRDGTFSVDLSGTAFDTLLGIYTGSAVGMLTTVASDDDSGEASTSRAVFAAKAGVIYLIAADGYNAASGVILLTLSELTTPTISSFSPSAAAPGAVVTIDGFNLGSVSDVKFGGISAISFTVLSGNRISAVVPATARSGRVLVAGPAGTSESSGWFYATRLPSVPAAVPDRTSITGFAAEPGAVSASTVFSLLADHLPGSLLVEAPTGFEVSLDGVDFRPAVEISAPVRSDRAANYPGGWTDGANAGRGFGAWDLQTTQGSGAAGAAIGNPEESGLTGLGTGAFSLFASPAGSGAWAYASREFNAPMAMGDSFSFRWAVNWDPNTSSGDNYFNLTSGGSSLLTIWQGNNPGPINFRAANGSTVNTGIAYGTGPMTWTFTLLDAATLRVTATRRDGSSEIVFTRDIAVVGAPDSFNCYAYQLDPDIRRRLYFDDLRIDSAFPGGGRLAASTVHVRLTANAPTGDVGGEILISSSGQSLASINVSGSVTRSGGYDDWLLSHGLDPSAPQSAPDADADGDKFTNGQEYAFGTSPAKGDPSLLTTTSASDELTVTWLQRSDVTYNVQSTTNLATTAFANDGTVSVVDGPTDPAPPAGYTRKQITVPASGSKFYRVTAATP